MPKPNSEHQLPRALVGMENLTRSTVAGFKWTYGTVVTNALLQVGYTAAMARLLSPQDFGLVAMALLFLRFGSYFAQMGVGQAVVQKPTLSTADVRAAFYSSLGFGLAFTLLVLAAAPLGSNIFDTEAVVPVIAALAFSFVLRGFGVTAEALLRRDLRFRAVAVRDVIAHVVGYLAVGLGAALAGAGVWSLVAAALSSTALSSLLAYVAVKHSLLPRFSLRDLRHLYSFGGRVSFSNFFEFLGNTLDTVFIGRYAGAAAIGQYNRAQLLVNLPLEQLTLGMTRVLFPAFSRIQTERERLRVTYLSAIRFIAVIVIPAAVGMAVAAPNLVRVVLGPQWEAAAAVLPALAVVAVANYISVLPAVTCEAAGALNKKLLLQLIHLALVAALLSLSIGQPLIVYASAMGVAALLRFGGYLLIMRRVLGLALGEHLKALAPVVLVAALVGLAAYGAGHMAAAAGIHVVLALAGQITACAIVLMAGIFFGPLAAARHDAGRRLRSAGLVGPDQGPLARVLDALLRFRESSRT